MRRKLKLGPVVAHGCYLVNLAGEAPVRRKSIAATAEELDRCARLGIECLVIHPGSHADPAVGIARIADGLKQVLRSRPECPVRILLETTAGAGHQVGRTFDQLAAILGRMGQPQRLGVCLDTCHVFAAGYDIRTCQAYARTMAELDRAVGLERLLAIHLNDSLAGLGSRLDRHAHIGRGTIGRRAFANFLNDSRLARVPMILETPKGLDEKGRGWDRINAGVLRSLIVRK